MESEHHTVSFPLRGFVTRRQNGNKIRSLGSFLATTTINLTKPNEIKTENNSSNSNFNDSFSLITQVIKSALFENQTDSRRFKPFSEVSSLISQLYEKFLQQNGSTIRINWLENHSNLVELVQENIPLIFSNLVKPSTTNNVTTFLVDVSLFLNSEENLRFTDDNLFLISLLYRLSFFRGIASYLNFSDKVSFEITLSLLNEKFYLNKLTPEIEQSIIKSPLRLKLAQFLDSNSSLHQLDHDQSLSHCLRKIEDSYKTLPQNIYFKNVFELEEHYLIEKDLNVREAIRDCLIECDRQVVLLIKQMDISLPYNRQEFQKCMIHGDIKVRRDLCFQLIRNFDRKLELKNIDSVVSRLRQSAKYTINQPRLVVGRESRAFGNQAYLFANSKLIQVDSRVLEQTKKLEFVSSMQNLKNLLTIHVREKLTLNYELTNLLAQFESKFENFLHELVPSLGRLLSLVYNLSKSSSFTQYNGVFQNLREALEIFARKSASEVEKQRKNFIENDSLTRLNGVSSVLLQHRKKQDNLAFFSSVLNALTELSGKSGQIEHSIQTIEELVYSLYSSKSGSTRAAFCVLLQRPSYTGADRFKSNELESKPEQEEALQKLVRTGGDHLYMSPSYEWISDATDLIEAVPLFIYERTIINDGKPTTVFEVDQEGLEQTVRQIAEFWAQNIERTIESEHICLARSFLIRLTPQFDILAKQIQNLNSVCLKDESNKNYQSINKEICDLLTLEAQVYTGKISKSELSKNIARLAQLISVKYNELAVEVEKVVEKAWSSQDFITRIEALERILLEKNQVNLDLLKEADKLETNREIERLSLKAFDRQRPLPAFHLLTTEAPGLIEGFITVVLEEEMAMRNVIKAHQLDDQVKEFSSRIQANLAQLAEKVIEEFGYEPIVSQHISNGSSKEQAVLRVMSENIPIQEQVASLAILTQMFHFEAKSDNELVSLAYLKLDQSTLESAEKYWSNQVGLDLKSINNEAIKQVYERNKTEPDFIEGLKKLSPDSFDTSLEVISQDVLIQFLLNDLIYSKEVQVATQWLMRAKSFDYTASKYNELHLKERAKCFIREHTALVQTTSRRLAISNNNLHNELCDPRYAFSSGVTFESTLTSLSPNSSHLSSCTSALPTGLRKRYHLIYGPSRVNLGKDERRSVENWSQFIGVSDPLAAKHAQDVYELINYSPVVRNVREAENLKVSENQWTALVRSCRNVQAFFVERLGVGDIEDLSYQFNQRGGINLGSLKEGEGYNSGPTAGYCIPKDLLFKLFVGTHQDARKLLQIGVPRFLHKYLLALMAEVYSRRNEFETVGEWELWAAEQFLNKDELSKRFASLDNTNREYVPAQISGYLQRFIALSGSQIVFHLAKLIQVLGNTGVPSPLLNTGRDLHSVLWSNWSDHKITLGAEQVNRSTVFTMTREIPESAKRSRLLNPNAGIVEEDSLRIQMFGVYKGDDDEPPPPDVRYSWTMRAFQILSGHYQAVADSLDLEGQVIARLSWVGFKPDSKDPRDIETTSYLLKKFNQENNPPQQMNEFTQRLKKAFPCHSTVGDITITAVPGVDSEDLLGFSAETLTLLGDEADRARQILESQGKMSIDQMKANATLRRKFPEEWTPLNQLSYSEQQRIKNLVGESIHPLVLRLRGPGTNFITDLQGQDVVVFSITHPEILKLNPAHLRDLMLVGRPNSALCALDFVAQGRHRCWYERDVMLWYAAARSLTLSGKLQFDWSKRNHFGRQSVYKAFGTGTDQYSPALGTDVRSEVVRQERRAIEIWKDKILNTEK